MDAQDLPPLHDWDVEVGRVVGAHGLLGETKVQSFSEAPDRFTGGNAVCVCYPEGRRELRTVVASRLHQGRLLVRFDGLDSRQEAEQLRGALLTIAPAMRRKLPPGRYYHDDLVGVRVETTAGRYLGRVTEILETPANDVLVTESALIPAVAEFVTEVDLESGRLVVTDVPGLVTGSAEE